MKIAIMRGYTNCQSCGMPLKGDKMGGGTNANGSKSAMYCSHCYEAGQFTLPNLTAKEMQTRVKLKLRDSGFPGIAAWIFTRNIPKLARWQSS